jgi:hypothetical protein
VQTKDLTAVFLIFAMVAGFATASSAEGCSECTGTGTSTGTDDGDEKGNNGWGNGIDPTNPGSNAGPPSQVETKNNREIWDKFDGKFEGR